LGTLCDMATPATRQSSEEQVARMYLSLARAWGRRHWWPAQSRFEVIVGAFLTQNTSWTNVELALQQLRSARVLNLPGIRDVRVRKLEQLIRSSGYFRQKATRLKNFVRFLDKTYGGSLTKMFAQPTPLLREQLLSLNGVGPETADSILTLCPSARKLCRRRLHETNCRTSWHPSRRRRIRRRPRVIFKVAWLRSN
jgi:endonuclease III-like uncharacterized protein